MNKFKKYLEISRDVQYDLMEYLIRKGIVKKHSDYTIVNDILFAYHNFPDGFTWGTMKSYLVIDQLKEGNSLSESTAKQWVNRKIEKMIDLGYAVKTNNPKDKRKIYINWTEKIINLYNDVVNLFEDKKE